MCWKPGESGSGQGKGGYQAGKGAGSSRCGRKREAGSRAGQAGREGGRQRQGREREGAKEWP